MVDVQFDVYVKPWFSIVLFTEGAWDNGVIAVHVQTKWCSALVSPSSHISLPELSSLEYLHPAAQEIPRPPAKENPRTVVLESPHPKAEKHLSFAASQNP